MRTCAECHAWVYFYDYPYGFARNLFPCRFYYQSLGNPDWFDMLLPFCKPILIFKQANGAGPAIFFKLFIEVNLFPVERRISRDICLENPLAILFVFPYAWASSIY